MLVRLFACPRLRERRVLPVLALGASLAMTVSAVAQGQAVSGGDPLVILESMKMEIPVESPVDGTVVELRVQEGGVVQEGDVIAVVE